MILEYLPCAHGVVDKRALQADRVGIARFPLRERAVFRPLQHGQQTPKQIASVGVFIINCHVDTHSFVYVMIIFRNQRTGCGKNPLAVAGRISLWRRCAANRRLHDIPRQRLPVQHTVQNSLRLLLHQLVAGFQKGPLLCTERAPHDLPCQRSQHRGIGLFFVRKPRKVPAAGAEPIGQPVVKIGALQFVVIGDRKAPGRRGVQTDNHDFIVVVQLIAVAFQGLKQTLFVFRFGIGARLIVVLKAKRIFQIDHLFPVWVPADIGALVLRAHRYALPGGKPGQSAVRFLGRRVPDRARLRGSGKSPAIRKIGLVI